MSKVRIKEVTLVQVWDDGSESELSIRFDKATEGYGASVTLKAHENPGLLIFKNSWDEVKNQIDGFFNSTVNYE